MFRSTWLVVGIFSLWIVAAAPSRADVQTNGGGWLMLMGQGDLESLSPSLSRARWWFDGQARFRDDSDGFHQSLVRPGLGFDVAEWVSLWVGYAWVRTEPNSGRNSHEHRIWQQLLWTPRLGSVSLQSRTRLEQRFVSTGDDTGWRAREFVKLARPFSSEPRLSLVSYDEIFIDLNDTDAGQDVGFAQNRAFVGLAWRFDEEGRVVGELGYLNQFIDVPSGRDTMNHLVSFNLFLK
jgi:hypothetical protein